MNRPLDPAAKGRSNAPGGVGPDRRRVPTSAWILVLTLAASPATAQSPDEIARHVEGFRDQRFAVREAASRALLTMGATAVPALRAALDAPDPEVRWRARTLLDALGALAPPSGVKEIRPPGFEGRVRLRFGQQEDDQDAEQVEIQINSNGRMIQVIRNTRTGEIYYDVDGTRYCASSDHDMAILERLEPAIYKLVRGFNRRLARAPVPAAAEYTWPTLGAQIVEPRAIGTNQPTGELMVVRVIPDSPAAKLDLREGDQILKVNGQLATRSAHIGAYLARVQVGQGYNLLVIRGGAEIRLEGRRER